MILSFVIRGLEALGASAYSTAGYVIIINIFPDNASAVRVSINNILKERNYLIYIIIKT